MPRIAVPTSASNQRLDTLLGAKSPATGWASGVGYQADENNTAALRIGDVDMTDDDYDYFLNADASTNDSPSEQNVMLKTRYVRNNSGTTQYLIVRVEGT